MSTTPDHDDGNDGDDALPDELADREPDTDVPDDERDEPDPPGKGGE
jgi:hypothetical protein